MSTESDSALGDPSRPGWTRGFQASGGPPIRRVTSMPALPESLGEASTPVDRLPFGHSLNNTSRAQSIAMPTASLGMRPLPGTTSVGATVSPLVSQTRQVLADQVTPLRLASHLSVLAVAALILILSQIDIPAWEVSLRLLPGGVESATRTAGSRVTAFATGNSAPLASHESLQRSAIPFTIVHEDAPQEFTLYTVKPGDTVLGIAQKFGLRPESVQWSNPASTSH